jgi:hypothetical protein
MRPLGIRAIAIGLLGLIAIPTALADLSDNLYYVEVCRADLGMCVGYYSVPTSQATWNGSAWVWQLQQDEPITNPQLGTLGTMKRGSFIEIFPTGTGLRSDPAVNLGFAMQAGNAETTFTVRSALLSFPTIANPKGRAHTAITATDGVDGAGGLLTGMGSGAGGGAYLAQYNAFVPGGTTFTELVPAISIPELDGATLNEAFPSNGGWQDIGVPVSNISTQISFTISANDLASGTSLFEITPEPSALLLGLLGLSWLRRR